MFYFGLGDATNGHAVILVAFSTDLVHWEKDPAPLYNAGGHPLGIDAQHAHKVRTGQRRPCCPKACNGLHPAYHAQQHPTIQRSAPTPDGLPHGIRHPASNIQHNIHHATSRRGTAWHRCSGKLTVVANVRQQPPAVGNTCPLCAVCRTLIAAVRSVPHEARCTLSGDLRLCAGLHRVRRARHRLPVLHCGRPEGPWDCIANV